MVSRRITIVVFCLVMAIMVCFSIFLLLSFTIDDAKLNKVSQSDYSKYGAISLTIAGENTDNIQFANTSLFQFTTIEENDLKNQNVIKKEGNDLSFYALRFLGIPGDNKQDSNVSFRLKVIDADLVTEKIFLERVNINEFAVLDEKKKYFFLNESFNTNSEKEGVTNFEISSYHYNKSTRILQFIFSFNVDGENNETGNTMSIIGNVDVML